MRSVDKDIAEREADLPMLQEDKTFHDVCELFKLKISDKSELQVAQVARVFGNLTEFLVLAQHQLAMIGMRDYLEKTSFG